MQTEVSLIADYNNCQVVQVAGRRYPGIVVQGDSLGSLVDLASDVVRLLEVGDVTQAKDTADELRGLLAARLRTYTEALERTGTPPSSSGDARVA